MPPSSKRLAESNSDAKSSSSSSKHASSRNDSTSRSSKGSSKSSDKSKKSSRDKGVGEKKKKSSSSHSSDKDKKSSKDKPLPLPGTTSPGSASSSSSSDIATMIGILVGVGVLIIVFVAIIVVCVKRRKKKKRERDLHIQAAGYNYNNPPKDPYNPNWYSGSNTSGGNTSSATSSQGGWPMPPPMPMMSGNTSGAYSSGPAHPPVPPPHPSVAIGFNSSTFTYDELAKATQQFSQANLLGQGGFGFVHKGVLPDGKEVAVKSLKSGSGQGEREFQAEVDIISRVHHRHLVSLVGYCIAGGQRMLVYEFVPNKTLEFHLHGKGQPVMSFATRLKIALGSAKGLAYLHEDCNPRIIHRDIKSANILLDHAFDAKVADFGLAKLSTDTNTHVSTRVMGTFGYLAPEYAASGKLTDRSDVFSFGVMLLELITGRRPIDPADDDDDSLVDWARPQFSRVLDEGKFDGFVDPCLENIFNRQEMMRMVACASASIKHSAKRRPKMIQIVRALEGDMSLDAFNEGVRPGQYKQDMENLMMSMNDDNSNTDYDTSNDYDQSSSRQRSQSNQSLGRI